MFSTPTFFRFCWVTVQIERTNSYSMGMPRSINAGGTGRELPRLHGHVEEYLIDRVAP